MSVIKVDYLPYTSLYVKGDKIDIKKIKTNKNGGPLALIQINADMVQHFKEVILHNKKFYIITSHLHYSESEYINMIKKIQFDHINLSNKNETKRWNLIKSKFHSLNTGNYALNERIASALLKAGQGFGIFYYPSKKFSKKQFTEVTYKNTKKAKKIIDSF